MIRIADYVRSRKGWQRFCLALAAGAGAGLALPPVDAWPLLFAAFPVLVWLIDGLPVRRPFVAFGLGWAFGAGYFAVCLYWVGAAFFVDVGTYLWMMPFAVGALAGGMALYWGAAVLAVSLCLAAGTVAHPVAGHCVRRRGVAARAFDDGVSLGGARGSPASAWDQSRRRHRLSA